MKPLLCLMPLCLGFAHAVPLTAEQMEAGLKTRPETDEIRWKDPARGAPLKVRIVSADSKNLVVDKTLTAGTTTRVVPMSDLAGVEFTLAPRELELHLNPEPAAIPALKILWQARSATLTLGASNASDTGLALAKSLRLTGESPSLDEASKILDQIRAQDSSEHRKDLARAEQTTVDFIKLQKNGDTEATDKLAWKIAESSGNPDAMLLATSHLTDRNFADLKKLVEEHPRWIEDDEVKPQRDRLYHLALDFALYPSLFLGSRETEAAAGLKKASEIYQFTGETLLEMKALDDLAALYPSSEAAKETAPILAKLKALEAAGKLTGAADAPEEEDKKPEEETKEEPASAGTPQPPKKYNMFAD
jgi:hypothetical protein